MIFIILMNFIPSILKEQSVDNTTENCPLCGFKLSKEHKTEVKIFNCHGCNWLGSRDCACTREEIPILEIKCVNCNSCKICLNQMVNSECSVCSEFFKHESNNREKILNIREWELVGIQELFELTSIDLFSQIIFERENTDRDLIHKEYYDFITFCNVSRQQINDLLPQIKKNSNSTVINYWKKMVPSIILKNPNDLLNRKKIETCSFYKPNFNLTYKYKPIVCTSFGYKIYFNVKYNERDIVKNVYKMKWDPTKKKWFKILMMEDTNLWPSLLKKWSIIDIDMIS